MVYVVYKFPGETQIAKVAGEASWRTNRQWHQSGKPLSYWARDCWNTNLYLNGSVTFHVPYEIAEYVVLLEVWADAQADSLFMNDTRIFKNSYSTYKHNTHTQTYACTCTVFVYRMICHNAESLMVVEIRHELVFRQTCWFLACFCVDLSVDERQHLLPRLSLPCSSTAGPVYDISKVRFV